MVEKLAQVGGVFALLTFLHFVADWIFQSHAEAMAKPTNSWIRARHCFVYAAICCSVIGLIFQPPVGVLAGIFGILFLSHFLEDTYLPVAAWVAFIRRPPEMAPRQGKSASGLKGFLEFAGTPLGKILLITVDQIVHLGFLLPVSCMLVAPHQAPLFGLFSLGLMAVLLVSCFIGTKALR